MKLLKRSFLGAFLLAILPLMLAGVSCGSGAAPGVSEAPSSAPAATPAPAPTQDSARTDSPKPSAASVSDDTSSLGNEGRIEVLLANESSQVAPQQRIIVRTVDMTLVVSDLSSTSDTISSLAVQFGGWVVSSRRDQRHRSSISIRVPAERLDEALALLRASALKVESEISSSQDFTDEYIDTRSKVKNLQATEAQLLKLLERADAIEDALKVQAEVTKVQGQIEKGQGRLNFLSETSAFSLININLKLGPMFLEVNAGPDPSSEKVSR